jgi:hypothetical protein
MSDISSRMLARIKKMLALANNEGATEGERAAALHHANLLLQKYNLSLADLPADQVNEPREEQVLVVCGDRWLRDICDSVAKLHFCNYMFASTGTSGKWANYFIGRQSNVVTAMLMSEYLIKSIKREATKRYRSPTSPEGRSFCVGMTRTLESRIYDMLLAAQTKGDSGPAPTSSKTAEAHAMHAEFDAITNAEFAGVKTTAVALASLYQSEAEANKAWIDERYGKVKTEKARQGGTVTGEAYRAGKAHGHSVGLNTQISGGTTPKRTLLN